VSTRRPLHVCVYCSSSTAIDPHHVAAAKELGRALAEAGHTLVWGGATVGLMGEVARAAREAGGRTEGIIPEHLIALEIADTAADDLVITPDMASRKAEMARRADAFVALPGGFGTLEELLEQLTLRLLAQHDKPVVLLDSGGFWQPLVAVFERLYEERFARPESRSAYVVTSRVDEVMEALVAAPATIPGKLL
jgi:uncharacterized protein (TIGR00730 family)